MKRTLIAAAVVAAFSGSAFAQQTQSVDNQDQTYLNDPARVGAFYTDDSMTTLRSSDEMRAAYDAMSEDDRAELTIQCEQEEIKGTDGTALCSEVASWQE